MSFDSIKDPCSDVLPMDSHQQQKGVSLNRAEGNAIYMCEHNTDIKKSFLTCAFKKPSLYIFL